MEYSSSLSSSFSSSSSSGSRFLQLGTGGRDRAIGGDGLPLRTCIVDAEPAETVAVCASDAVVIMSECRVDNDLLST